MGGRIMLFAIISYLIGSFPTAYLMDKDVFKKGSGNMGAFNILKTNKSLVKTGIVLCADMLKGILIVLLSQAYWPGKLSVIVGLISGQLGHDYSIWLEFKGGKGLALACGGFLLLEPAFLIIIGVVAGLLYLIFKDNVKAGLVSVPIIAVIALFLMDLSNYFLLLISISGLLITHKDLIKLFPAGKAKHK